jgi:hypothetical protein
MVSGIRAVALDARIFLFLSAGLILIGLAGCTRMGPSGVLPKAADLNPGPDVAVRVCMYQDVNVSDRQAAGIIAAIQKEFAPYGLIVHVPVVKPWRRPSFQVDGILRDIASRPLDPHVDRIFALVGRDVRDFLWGAVLPEVLGAVETRTHTKGFVVAEMGSLNQLLSFRSPAAAAVHEFYHLLGCAHGDDSQAIAAKIAHLKRLAVENRQSGRDFFPGIGSQGRIYLSRRAVDRQFGLAASQPVADILTAASLDRPVDGAGQDIVQ